MSDKPRGIVMTAEQQIRIRFFADTHLGFDYPIRPRIERRRRGQDFFNNFQRVLDGAVAAKVDLLVHGGDLFFRSRIPSKIVELTYSALFEFAEKGIPIIIVPGNHERSSLPASLYLAHPNIYVFARAMTYAFEFGGKRVCVSGFPFERKDIKGRFVSVLNETGWVETDADVRILCIHQAVESATVGPSNYTFRSGNDVIRLADIPDSFDAVLAGHIHRRQILHCKAKANGKSVQVIYPGSIERTSFAEKDEEKGFYDVTFCRQNEKGWQLDQSDFKRLPSRPMRDIYLDENITEFTVESFLAAHIENMDNDAIVRIRSKGKPNNGLKDKMTSAFLRRVFPVSMNVQLGGEFRAFRKRKKKR